jgi:uncharacterized membrane protein (DUF106 family)
MTYGVGNPGPDLGQAQKPVSQFSCLDLPFYMWMYWVYCGILCHTSDTRFELVNA